jgi:hypothetical protein
VVGVEIDPVAAEQARMYGMVYNDPRTLPANLYDVIQIKNVLSNIEDMWGFLACYLRLLKPGGYLFLDVLNQDGLTCVARNLLRRNYRFTGRYGPLRPPYVINGFNRSSLSVLGRRAGLHSIWTSTSFAGSSQVPYQRKPMLTVVGVASTALGQGSMIISEWQQS